MASRIPATLLPALVLGVPDPSPSCGFGASVAVVGNLDGDGAGDDDGLDDLLAGLVAGSGVVA